MEIAYFDKQRGFGGIYCSKIYWLNHLKLSALGYIFFSISEFGEKEAFKFRISNGFHFC